LKHEPVDKAGGRQVNGVFRGWTVFFFFSGQMTRGDYNIAKKIEKAHPNTPTKGGNENEKIVAAACRRHVDCRLHL
jgi:hypothetical protein